MTARGEVEASAPQGSSLPRPSHLILDRHVAREFLLSFIVSFLFFFVIFFINQILLLVQQVALRNVDVPTIIRLVVCAIPQFLQYVVPFATLSSSSMVLGDLASANELMALRSSGIALSKVYRVLVVLSILLSVLTFYICDYLMPLSSRLYQQMLSDVMRELPTFELRENATNTVGGIVMRNGATSGGSVEDIVLLTKDGGPYVTLSSPHGSVSLIDLVNYIYELDLSDADLMLSEDDIGRSVLSSAQSALMYLDFSQQLPSMVDTSPGNLSSAELWPLMQSRKMMRDELVSSFHAQREEVKFDMGQAIRDAASLEDLEGLRSAIEDVNASLAAIGEDEPVQFYYQYYSAEFNKKFALSLACLCLTVVTLPLSLVKIRYGRLVGFGLSLLIAVAYWYLLFASQLRIFDFSFNAGFLMYLPDAVMLVIGLGLLWWKRRRVG